MIKTTINPIIVTESRRKVQGDTMTVDLSLMSGTAEREYAVTVSTDICQRTDRS